MIDDFVRTLERSELFYLLLPLPLIAAPMLWVLAYYFGIDDARVTYAINIGLRAILSAFFFALGLWLLAKDKGLSAPRLAVLIPAIFFSASFCAAAAEHGLTASVKQAVGVFFLNAIPALFVGVYCAKNKAGCNFLRGMERCGLVFVPAAVMFIVPFLTPPEDIHALVLPRLGRLNYMSFAYALLPLLAASCLLLLEEGDKRWKLCWRLLLVCLYWLAIIFTQTKGAVVGGEMPPINSATSNLVKSVFDKENGLEEAVFRRTDHRLFAAGGGWCSDQGTMPATRLQ